MDEGGLHLYLLFYELSALSYELIGPVAFRLPITRDLALSLKTAKKSPFKTWDVLPGALY